MIFSPSLVASFRIRNLVSIVSPLMWNLNRLLWAQCCLPSLHIFTPQIMDVFSENRSMSSCGLALKIKVIYDRAWSFVNMGKYCRKQLNTPLKDLRSLWIALSDQGRGSDGLYVSSSFPTIKSHVVASISWRWISPETQGEGQHYLYHFPKKELKQKERLSSMAKFIEL